MITLTFCRNTVSIPFFKKRGHIVHDDKYALYSYKQLHIKQIHNTMVINDSDDYQSNKLCNNDEYLIF